MSDTLAPIEVFCSYALNDESYFKQLQRHLRVLELQERIVFWHPRLITPGTDWAETIDRQVNRASVILLLISADFLDPNYCNGVEMKRALERHSVGEARVIPILLRPVDWQDAPFEHLQKLPSDGRPITKWGNRDEAFADVAKGIRAALQDVQRPAVSLPKRPVVYDLFADPNLPSKEQPLGESVSQSASEVDPVKIVSLNASRHKKTIPEMDAQDIIDTHESIYIFNNEIMHDNTQKRIFCLLGKENTGKSHFLGHILSLLAETNFLHSKGQSLSGLGSESVNGANPINNASANASWYKREVRCALVNLEPKKGCSTVPEVLSQVCTQLGDPYSSAYQTAEQEWMMGPHKTYMGGPETLSSLEDYEARHLTTHFIKALSRLTDQRILLLFDQVDQAESVKRWLMNNLLIATFPLKHVRVVLAGRSLPEPHGSYRRHCIFRELCPITQIEEYIIYCNRQSNSTRSEYLIRILAHACDYIPGTFVKLLPRFTGQEWSNG